MKKKTFSLTRIIFFLIVAFNLILASWYVIHGDIHFSTEIARDFFLLLELLQKKIILIGPSSSAGLFHGPLWTYVNFPAYFLGGGNPITVGWYWIFLIVLFLISCFYIAKKIFNQTTAYLFVLMTSLYMVFHAKWLYNPYGAMFLIPAFFFFIIAYVKTEKMRYLVLHIFLLAAIIQFQMAIGIPFLILSFIYVVGVSTKTKRFSHLLLFLLILIPLGNFILFDLRHDFILSKITLRYLHSSVRNEPNFVHFLQERLWLMVSGTEILREDPGYRNFFIFAILLFFIILQIRDNKYKIVYFSFLYFYVGFFVFSLINPGPLLYFYLFPLFPFVFLIFSSFVTSRHKYIFLIIFFIIYAINTQTAIKNTKDAEGFFGKSIYSWKALQRIASVVYKGSEKEFGYFVYAPNVVAFEGKYAMLYLQKQHKKKPFYFVKKPITYLIIAPPPSNNPYMKDEWWRINQVRISVNPKSVIKFENGYKIEKYFLDDKQIRVIFDHNIDPGIHFR